MPLWGSLVGTLPTGRSLRVGVACYLRQRSVQLPSSLYNVAGLSVQLSEPS